jgi:hypothetical protein
MARPQTCAAGRAEGIRTLAPWAPVARVPGVRRFSDSLDQTALTCDDASNRLSDEASVSAVLDCARDVWVPPTLELCPTGLDEPGDPVPASVTSGPMSASRPSTASAPSPISSVPGVRRSWRETCAALGLVHKRTRPYRPQTNGKIERFHRTLGDGWAYARFYNSETERREALPGWVHFYNHHRAHTAIGGKPPVSRQTNQTGLTQRFAGQSRFLGQPVARGNPAAILTRRRGAITRVARECCTRLTCPGTRARGIAPRTRPATPGR